jgi:hypothetical protein
MLSQQTINKLHELKLTGMAEAFADQLNQPDMDRLSLRKPLCVSGSINYLDAFSLDNGLLSVGSTFSPGLNMASNFSYCASVAVLRSSQPFL